MITGTQPATQLHFDTYLDPATLPYAFCPGCSHGRILDQLNAALVALQLNPHSVVIVTDIGCVGLSDKYFRTHAFHGLHGRSVTYATGIKLANPDLKVIVLMGDGGCGIGGHHLLNAARRNIGMTVLVFNNLNFGMTGGQHSVTTPLSSITPTTPRGHLEQPLDIVSTVAVNGAGFAARTTAFDPELPELIAQAIDHNGFSLLDIWELCVAHYVPSNDFSRQALKDAMAHLGTEPCSVHRADRPEFTRAYQAANAALKGQPTLRARPLPVAFDASLDRSLQLIIAGAAGQRVRTAATLLAAGAVLSGLWATRRDDYPITVRSGHSISEVILSPVPIHYTGIEQPDVIALLAPEGAARMQTIIAHMAPEGKVYVVEALKGVKTPAQKVIFSFPAPARWHIRKSLATLAVGRLVQDLDLFPLDALREAIRRTQRPAIAELNLAAIDAVSSSTTLPLRKTRLLRR